MEKIILTGVPETMLQTVFARAQETKKPNHKITDEKAVEIVSRLDYDFSLAATLPDFELIEEHSLVEGMEIISPVYKVIGKIPAVRNMSNKIIVLEGGIS